MRKSQDDGIVWQLGSRFLPSYLVKFLETMTECDTLFSFIDNPSRTIDSLLLLLILS